MTFGRLRHCACGTPIKGPSRNKTGRCQKCIRKSMHQAYVDRHRKAI